MMSVLRRRGPDAEHFLFWDTQGRMLPESSPHFHQALLHARLAIIDPQSRADQPMCDLANQLSMVFNGEIYNWRALRAELSDHYSFRTQSDSECLLAGFSAWGFEKLLQKIDGMFALAIFHHPTQTLYLARDRLGKKPLVYHHSQDAQARLHCFAFASMVDALLPLHRYFPKAQQGINPAGVDCYLAHRTVMAPQTLYRGIQRLAPASALIVNLQTGVLRHFRYWQAPWTGGGDALCALHQAIDTRLCADRPVGIFLSGGVDSTVIAQGIAQEKRSAITAYTAGFAQTLFDESATAAENARILGYRHRVIPIEPNLRRDFSRIVADFDEPFADPSALPTWYLAQEVTQEVKVVLCGDGGDEWFNGYKRCQQQLRTEAIFSRLGAGLMRRSVGSSRLSASFFFPELFPHRWQRLINECRWRFHDPRAAYALRFSGFSPWQRLALYQPALVNSLAMHEHSDEDLSMNLRSVYWHNDPQSLIFPHGHAQEMLMAIDASAYLPEYLLRKADLATMAHGLEARAPLLDRQWIEALLALPAEVRWTSPPKKWLLNTLSPMLRQRLIHAPKRGFNPPLRQWIMHDLAERLDGLGQRISRHCPWMNPQAMTALIAMLRTGDSPYHMGKMPERLYQLLVLDEHLQQQQHWIK